MSELANKMIKEYREEIFNLQKKLIDKSRQCAHLYHNLDKIRSIMSMLLMKQEKDGTYKPIKNTSRKDCYKALYDIQEILCTNRMI